MDAGLIAIGAGLGAGLVTIGAGLGIGKITAAAAEATGRQRLRLLVILELQHLLCQL